MSVEQRIRALVRRIVGIEELRRELAAHQAPLARSAIPPEATFPLGNWWERSFWEHTVALAIRDHCRAGDVVFDVGANAGAMALMMSRLVGPRGIVCAFEASPRIIDKTHYNLVRAGCHNVTLFHRAVWHTTGALVDIAAGSHLNDRIEHGATGMSVRTVTLDDIAAAGDLKPTFVKMDIEGAEHDALQGMKRLLQEVRPVLVLEQTPADTRCLEMLLASEYEAVDLATYRRLHLAADLRAGGAVANVLFVPRERAGANPYCTGSLPLLEATLSGDRFLRAVNGDVSMPVALELRAGRYIVRADFTADGDDNEVFAGIEADDVVIFRYHTFTRFMASSYTDWVIQLDHSAVIRPYLRFIRGFDASLCWNGARVFRLPSFDGWTTPIIE